MNFPPRIHKHRKLLIGEGIGVLDFTLSHMSLVIERAEYFELAISSPVESCPDLPGFEQKALAVGLRPIFGYEFNVM
jgi:hypothetical protein